LGAREEIAIEIEVNGVVGKRVAVELESERKVEG
jgi:hypothetical protein